MIEKSENGFYIGNVNKPDAQILFIETDVININYTYVSETLRGQGIALKLLEKVIEYAKEKNKKILPTCSYAISKLKDEKYKDIVVNKILLVFDFFGVICSEISSIWLKDYFSEEEIDKMRETIFYKVDTGAITFSHFLEELSKLSGVKREFVEQEWMNLVSINKDVLDLIMKYKNTCRIALLTNASSPFVRRIISDNHLENYFELILVSSEVGLAKPNTEFYKLLLNKLNVEPINSIMIDDNIKNIEAAKSIHMNTIHFDTAQKLEEDLKKFNLL